MIKPITRRGQAAGFSLIEVLIALVVLGFGLLGLALLQTMNLRYTQSANQRTQAVNLAGELMDMIRSNRSQISAYQMAQQSMASVPPARNGCAMDSALGADNNVDRWKCEVREALGPGAKVQVDADATSGLVKVTMIWNEGLISSAASMDAGKVEMTSQL